MGMGDKMKEKALSGTSVVRSSKVVKSIDKADAFELNKANEFVALQSRREDIDSTETFKGYKSVESPYVKRLVR